MANDYIERKKRNQYIQDDRTFYELLCYGASWIPAILLFWAIFTAIVMFLGWLGSGPMGDYDPFL